MKPYRVVVAAIIFLLAQLTNVRAQSINELPMSNVIPSFPIEINCSKTTNLVFPFNIKSIDRGSKEVLVQKAIGVENVLQLKAAKENFGETNLSVITGDGKFYSFVIKYSNKPSAINFHFLKDSSAPKETVSTFPGDNNEAIMDKDAQYIMEQPRSVFGKKDKKYGMRIRLTGLYIRDNVLYFQLQLENRSNIDYDIDMVHFFIKDRKQSRRTATQEIAVAPLYIVGNLKSIRSDTSQSLVVALPKFTIPDKKKFHVQMMERGGGRHLELKVGNRKIIKSIQLRETA